MSPTNPNSQLSEDQELFGQLLKWADLSQDPRWQAIAPEDRDKIVNAIKEIAALPVTQAEVGAPVQFVCKKRVFNLRPLVLPAVVAILVKATVIIVPGLDSALLPLLDLLGFAEKAREVYEKLNDDEVDVFGAIAELYTESELRHSITDPNAHPTAKGVKEWFVTKGFQAPEDIDGILQSLAKKGALLDEQSVGEQILYSPTFLGRKKKHE